MTPSRWCGLAARAQAAILARLRKDRTLVEKFPAGIVSTSDAGWLPCTSCGETVRPDEAGACPECGADPAAETVPCTRCDGEGVITVADTIGTRWGPRSSPWDARQVVCPLCDGARVVEAPFADKRAAFTINP